MAPVLWHHLPPPCSGLSSRVSAAAARARVLMVLPWSCSAHCCCSGPHDAGTVPLCCCPGTVLWSTAEQRLGLHPPWLQPEHRHPTPAPKNSHSAPKHGHTAPAPNTDTAPTLNMETNLFPEHGHGAPASACPGRGQHETTLATLAPRRAPRLGQGRTGHKGCCWWGVAHSWLFGTVSEPAGSWWHCLPPGDHRDPQLLFAVCGQQQSTGPISTGANASRTCPGYPEEAAPPWAVGAARGCVVSDFGH